MYGHVECYEEAAEDTDRDGYQYNRLVEWNSIAVMFTSSAHVYRYPQCVDAHVHMMNTVLQNFETTNY